jgi:hypothetical protein
MQCNKALTLLAAVGILLAATGFWLATATPASAQCGSQASSCKNCHEVQGQTPVNGDGTAWHTSHAFGDFCYICHAGNNQSKDKIEAHTGMVPPLSDIQASCMQCHPDDLQERAQVYAAALGVEIGSSTASSSGEAATVSSSETPQTVTASALAVTELEVDDPNLVNYIQRYNEIVLDKTPFNWGNAILVGLIGLIAVGGGGFVAAREKLIRVSFGETKLASGEYPADIVELLPTLTSLKPASRSTLKNLLRTPKKTEKVLNLIDAVITDEKSEVI